MNTKKHRKARSFPLPARISHTLREKFLAVRADSAATGATVARVILPDPLFGDKLDLALRVILRWRYRQVDLRQAVAARTCSAISKRLAQTRGSEFLDQEGENAEDEFGAWLFCLARFYVRMALLHELRSRRTRRFLLNGRRPRLPSLPGKKLLPEGVYERALEVVVQTVNGFNDRLREVMLDHLAGVPRRQSAEKLGVSENRVSQLRREGCAVVKARLQEEVAAYLP